MKYKQTIPYLFFGLTFFGTGALTTAHGEHSDTPRYTEFSPTPHIHQDIQNQINMSYLKTRADSLCEEYMTNMLTAHAKLNPLLGTHGYQAAVRRELPGATVGQHCMWGQHTQLSRALHKMGDTVTIIPRDARTTCIKFKQHMRNKYQDDAGCIYEGVLYESDSAYNAALARHLARHNIDSNTPDSTRNHETAKFARNHINADKLNPGAILIVPRSHGNRSQFHAITFLGRGRIENKTFVPDSLGRHIYVGHNREKIGDLFNSYDTSNIFAADTKQIATVEYARQLQRIMNMSYTELTNFLTDADTPPQMLRLYTHDALVRMARDKYLKIADNKSTRETHGMDQIFKLYQWPVLCDQKQRGV